jgi:hypothetical protein
MDEMSAKFRAMNGEVYVEEASGLSVLHTGAAAPTSESFSLFPLAFLLAHSEPIHLSR